MSDHDQIDQDIRELFRRARREELAAVAARRLLELG